MCPCKSSVESGFFKSFLIFFAMVLSIRDVSVIVKSFSIICRSGLRFTSSVEINVISMVFSFFLGILLGITKFPFVFDLRGFIVDIISSHND